MILGIDCSATPSGGGRRHIIELLSNFELENSKFNKIKLYGGKKFLDTIPMYPWLEKVSHPFLEKSVLYKMYWRLFLRDKSYFNQFDILFSPFGTYTGSFKPFVSMSRNMLIFDINERNRFKFSLMWIKLNILFFVQKMSFKKADGIIFISNYAKNIISDKINIKSIPSVIINHGVSTKFKTKPRTQYSIKDYSFKNPFKLLFLSSIWVYKHPLQLLKAVEILINKGYPIELNIVGDNAQKKIGNLLEKELKEINNKYGEVVNWQKSVGLDAVREFYLSSEMFVFTSTCENMPNILIEAMASGLPICCSKYSPMPEFLEDGGMYFDPLDSADIAYKIEKLLVNTELRKSLSEKSYILSTKYTWEKCTNETFKFLSSIVNKEHV